ncbi:cobalt-precorrin 5A hydrolase [Fusobacterium sp.]|uniref:cobalt-precorrin 5A hydrolase n=1 Tax=Fusobacterium sp. TaxID=68766 RepID=UPI00396C31AA
MKIAIWSVTRGAGKVALKLSEKISADVYTLKKFEIDNSIQMENFTDKLESKFSSYDAHIFIMATGIVVRKIASLIKRKDTDPAVLVIDEKERFVISLLSGHLGGANELTEELAEKFSLLPVVTTSSDITGKIAIDTLSQKMQCQMENLEKAKNITSLIVDNKNVDILLPKNVTVGKNCGTSSGVVISSNKENIEVMRIYPENLIIGVGCRRGTVKENILIAIEKVMKKHNLSYRSIKKIATVDVKADEKGLIEAAKALNKELIIVDRKEIAPIENMFKGSEFVKKQIGVTCVSEPCAYIVSNKNGIFLEKKFIDNGITISIYEEKFGDE